MAGEEVSREVFRLLPQWQAYLFYIVAIITIVAVVLGIVLKLRRYGFKTIFRPPGGFWRRLGKGLKLTIINSTVMKGNRFAGLMHLAIFWGMIVLFIGTLIITLEEDILRPFAPGLMFWHGDFYVLFSFGMEVFGLLLIGGLLIMIGRRVYLRKTRMNYDTLKEREIRKVSIFDDWFFVILLLIIAVGGFAVEGLRLVADGISSEPYSFLGTGFASFLQWIGVSPGMADAAYPTSWWLHAITALVFVGYLPFSKAWHIFSGFLSIMMSDQTAGKALPRVDVALGEDHAEESQGIPGNAPVAANPGPVGAFTGRERLMLDACVRCGRCHEACPAKNSGYPLSPRDVILELRRKSFGKEGIGGNGKKLAEYVSKDTLWSCTTCFACMEQCPMKIEHLPFIVNMRRELVDEGDVDAQVQETLEKMTRYGNSFGKSERMRAKWTKGLDFKIRDARKEEVDYLWFVGDYASYDDRVIPITQKTAKVFEAAGLKFGLLQNDERNSGNDVRRIGEEGLFEMLAEKNLAGLEKASFDYIVTTDPHTLNTLKNEYSQFNGGNGGGGANSGGNVGAIPNEGFKVKHYTELLWELIGTNKLNLKKKLGYTVTYHDPCYLGRYNDIYDEPRRILEALGVKLVEMDRHRETGYCCGAGGGRIWMEDTPGIEERPADNRISEAVALDSVDTFVVSCPKDYVMFGDAVKSTNNEGRIVVRDIAELVYEALNMDEDRKKGGEVE
jgi:Fe-S oxidoreductase/nitrate reductase gamma subunit